MILTILIMVAIIWYWIAEGATEGYTFAPRARRMLNLIIKPGKWDDPDYKKAKGFWCYHTWRDLGEKLGILLGLILAFLMGQNGLDVSQLIFAILGASGVGIFAYERVFNHISYGELFPQKKSYDSLNGFINMKHQKWLDWVILAIGIFFVIKAL